MLMLKDFTETVDSNSTPEKRLEEFESAPVKPMNYLERLALPRSKQEPKRKYDITIDPEVRQLFQN